jgi:hypothetical protein
MTGDSGHSAGGTDRDEEELYRDALDTIRSAQQDRERQFPKIEAIRQSWKDTLDDIDGERDARWIKCLLDLYTREIQDILDPDEEHDINTDQWLEFGYQDRSVDTSTDRDGGGR